MSAEQQNINYGASANDGTGDPLRTAFIKTDENFSNIWAAGPVGSNVTITNNTISVVNTNGNLVLSPNGVGVVQVNNTVVPRFGNSYDLGTTAAPFRSAHIQGVYAANYYYANGAPFSGGGSNYGNANVAAYLPTYSGNIGNIRAESLRSPQSNIGNASISNLISGNATIGTANIAFANFSGNVTLANIVNSSAVNIITEGDRYWRFAGNRLQEPNGGSLETSGLTTYLNSAPNGYVNIASYSEGNLTTDINVDHDFIELFIRNGVNVNWRFNSNGTTDFPYYTFPNYDGDNGQVLITNGAGEIQWGSPTSGITFEYDIANFTANATPAVGTMQFTNRAGEVVAPDSGTRLFINAVDGTGINTGSTWLAMAENSERGTITLQQDGAQTPYRVTDIGVYNTPETYRGYRAGVNQIWGDDPSINQIIITNAADPVFYNPDFDIEDDIFHATNLADATAVYMVNVYGSDDFTPLPQDDLWNFFTSFVDNVIYQGTDTETLDAAEIRTAFYTNFGNFYSSINSTKYDPEFRFASGTTYYSSAPATGGSGDNARLRVRLNANYTYTVMGISVPGSEYEVDDTITILGDQLNGATPANDLVVTVNTVDGNGGITGVTLVSGVAAFPWRSNNISDGGDDQYDTGNYINTNLAQEILYAGGNVTAGTTQFGADSEYVVMYNSSIFCMAATGVDITDLYYSGNLGADSDGFLRWSGLRNPSSSISVEYAYMRCEQGTGNLEPLPDQTYQVGLDSGGINLDRFYSYYNDSVNSWYFGADRDWRLESRQQLNVQSYNTLTLRTLLPNEPTGLGSPDINISTDTGSDGNGQVNLQAGTGGSINIQAGDAGSDSGVPSLGNHGGAISILAGDATGNGFVGGGVLVAAGQGDLGTAGNLTLRTRSGATANGAIRLETNNLDDQKTWIFDATGNLTLPAGGDINEVSGQTTRFQALNEDGLAQAGVILNAGDGLTRLESFDSLTSSSYTNSDWTTGQYIENGGFGEINFTNAPTIVSFLTTVNDARLFYQVNGGNLLPSSGWGTGGNNVTFYTDIPPATSPVTVDNFVIYYSYRSRIEMDYDEGELNIVARDLDINIRGDQEVDIRSDNRLRLETSGNVDGVEITTDGNNAYHTWNFNVNGSLTLPGGNAVIDSSDDNIELRSTNNINFETANVVNVYTNDGGYQWQFGDNGALILAPISVGETGESATVRGSRTIVGGFDAALPYVVEIPGHTEFGNIAWTASSGSIQSAKITFVVQSGGSAFQWEQFDVSVCKFDGANAFVTVSNRIKQNSSIADTQVEAYDSEGSLAVWLNPADGQTIAWVNYQAVEFGLMVD